MSDNGDIIPIGTLIQQESNPDIIPIHQMIQNEAQNSNQSVGSEMIKGAMTSPVDAGMALGAKIVGAKPPMPTPSGVIGNSGMAPIAAANAGGQVLKKMAQPIVQPQINKVPTQPLLPQPKINDLSSLAQIANPSVAALLQTVSPRFAVQQMSDLATNPTALAMSMPETKVGEGVANAAEGAFTGAQKGMEDLGNNMFRGGVPKEEVARLSDQYGNSNASLVDQIKQKLNSKISSAEDNFGKIIQKAPNDIQLPVNRFKNAVQKVLRDNGIINKNGTVVPGIGKDDRFLSGLQEIYANLKQRISLNNPSRIAELEGEKAIFPRGGGVTGGESGMDVINKLKEANKMTDKLSKPMYLRTKAALKNLLSGDGEADRNVYELISKLDDDAASSGIKGLKEAKNAYRLAKLNEAKFLNRNTGDLKVATEQTLNKIGSKPIPKQVQDHITELQKYIDHPILSDATKINRINQAADRLSTVKKVGAGAVIGSGLTAAGVPVLNQVRKAITGG